MIDAETKPMYPLPDDFDEKILNETYLQVVTFGAGSTSLVFSKTDYPGVKPYEVTIVSESPIAYEIDGVAGIQQKGNLLSYAPLIGLVLRDVSKLTRQGVAGLKIEFQPQASIFLDDMDDGFESYSIYVDDQQTIYV